jgi:hypothetical protein
MRSPAVSRGTAKIKDSGAQIFVAETTATPENSKLYKAEYVGSGTFIISKPSRKKAKRRQSNLKNVKRGSRK